MLGGKQSLFRYVGNSLPGWCWPLVPRLSCTVWLIFNSWPHAQNLGCGHPEAIQCSGVRLHYSNCIWPLCVVRSTLGSHLVTGMRRSPSPPGQWQICNKPFPISRKQSIYHTEVTGIIWEPGVSHFGGCNWGLRFGFVTWCQWILK